MKAFLSELKKILGDRVKENEPMSLHTTFKIGGPARYYIDIDSIEGLVKVVTFAKKRNLPVFIFGGGSNIIVSDRGIDGLVIKNNCRKFEIRSIAGNVKGAVAKRSTVSIYAQSGVIMNQLVRYTIDHGMGGLEFHLGLPGTVGGALFMNSNFPKKQSYVGDSLQSATLLCPDGSIKEIDASYFRFSYDTSILQKTGEIILSALFKLSSCEKDELWRRGTEALDYRLSTQPKGASAGCTFRNISISEAFSIPTPNNITSAGYLIDKAGLKGRRVGDAMVSPKHANFILNMGNAKASDVVELTKCIKEEVFKKFSVSLMFEVRVIES
ncbi:MAG: UDP-N-acetylenolpyruvoylglucosamine reductase [Candidatus Levybacteria bacterium RIFCSPHIGHO2_02_FULL_42_12]|nr:MAG: UDP-N-acetylenolpyruvoylglucosamine reductase [Candidatus Levybacteria bacterium RIFCSPHIGHO2_01_FULL_42_15]OGH33956.1 MAG: UDP-N-acetylenolpyruvoylglucosamine reductase [Candidatus Levybacteria bacterium RIFCSPHIGHO2_02_FULL_42_12]OGH42891.1 MAG: UDP-N-acetylenolpyruvoylglucosamine reductase [Candidatus Levybacteria bacterium RIFCSPLOWO2_01_FULL_42_15]